MIETERKEEAMRFVTSQVPNCRRDVRLLANVQHKHVNTDA